MSVKEQGSPTIDGLLAEARGRLATSRAETSPREALTLLGHVLTLGEAQLLARGEMAVASAEAGLFRRLIMRRLAGEPVAYLIGSREFYGREFTVDQRVLIPRPETEHLVEAVLGLELGLHPRIVDIGTGSGAIAVTLACEIEGATVLATDLDADALAVARDNARRLGVQDRVRFVRGDLAAALRLEEVDLVVSNPPYVATGKDNQVSFEVHDFEPHMALFAAGRGRGLIRRLLQEAERLRPGVHLLIEIGFDQGTWLTSKVEASAHLELVELVRDYGGHERTAVLRRI